MNQPTTKRHLMPICRKPEKIVVLDGSETGIIIKERVQGVKIEDQKSGKRYIIQRTVKNGLQMIGAKST